jgi:hypothetical protein
MTRILLVFTMLACAAPALPCSVSGVTAPNELVSQAEAIVWARAEALSSTPGRPGVLAGDGTQVRFSVLEVLKGKVPTPTIEFNGSVMDADDHNDRPIPYDFVRPMGRAGNCFALRYRPGGEYLLLLRRAGFAANAQPNDLTPYWSPLAPTNEQLFGGRYDPWLAWVRSHLR